MRQGDRKRFLKQYDAERHLYEEFAPKLESLLNTLMHEAGIRPHSVTSRVKEPESLSRKLGRSGSSYGRLEDLTDLLGMRVVTYFHQDVDTAAEIVEREFTPDPQRSTDKRAVIPAEQFGYISLHYVATLSDDRAGLSEWKRSRDRPFEIQLRSILQHAWAEIEHDLGYKAEEAIPRDIRRRFSRVAGLLEVADSEFSGIRKDLGEYVRKVEDAVVTDPGSTLLDQASLSALVSRSSAIQIADQAIATYNDSFINKRSGSAGLATKLSLCGLDTIEAVTDAFDEHRELVLNFAQAWLTESWRTDEERARLAEEEFEELDEEEWEVFEADADALASFGGFSPGISLFYLCYVLVAETQDAEVIQRYLEQGGIGNRHGDESETATELLGAYRYVIDRRT